MVVVNETIVVVMVVMVVGNLSGPCSAPLPVGKALKFGLFFFGALD